MDGRILLKFCIKESIDRKSWHGKYKYPTSKHEGPFKWAPKEPNRNALENGCNNLLTKYCIL
jgi:hypothetical protein